MMKLEWEKNPPKNLMSWDGAMEYAESLGEGWRLPTRTELIEAHDNNMEGFQSDYYWSSSEYDQNTIFAWNVNFNNGYVYYNSKIYSIYVRCVREVK